MTTRRGHARRNVDELRADPALPGAVQAGIERGDRRGLRAAAWALLGVGGQAGAGAAERELQEAARNRTVAVLQHPDHADVQVRCMSRVIELSPPAVTEMSPPRVIS